MGGVSGPCIEGSGTRVARAHCPTLAPRRTRRSVAGSVPACYRFLVVPGVDGANGDPAKAAADSPRPLTDRIVDAVALMITGVWGVLSLLIGSNAGLHVGAILLIFGGAVVLFFGWLFSLVRRTWPTRRPPFPRRWLRFLLAPLFIVVCSGAVCAGLPFRVRFALSKADLQRYAEEVTKSPPPWGLARPVSVGLFEVEEVRVLPNGIVRMTTTACGVVDSCGVVYSPRGPPPSDGGDRYNEIGDGWWCWYNRF